MELEIYKIDGNTAGEKINLPEEIFGIEPNDHAIYLAVKSYRANQRQGTHKQRRGKFVAETRNKKEECSCRYNSFPIMG
jgi:large subunit ribosomal protein L4